MKEARDSGSVRGLYEAPALSVVAVRGGRLLSASPWTAQGFNDPEVECDWERSSAQGFLGDGSAEFSWGGLPGVDGFEAQGFNDPEVECDWERSSAQWFLGDGSAEFSWGGLPGVDGFKAQGFNDPAVECDWSRSGAQGFSEVSPDVDWEP